MKKIIINSLIIFALSFNLQAQSKPSIAAGNPNVNGLYASPTIASKLIRLELIKLDMYSVYDEFDMEEVYATDSMYKTSCLSKSCLVDFGSKLNVDYMVSGSYDKLGNKIVISIKIIDVKNNTIHMSGVREFNDDEAEMQRMTEILLREMHGLDVAKEINDRLKFNNEMITNNNVGKINNSGPRIGYAMMTGSISEFATRPADQGGLDIFPGVSMIGYQIEGQYVGTENFSALVEGIFNVSGLEQGRFIPTISLLNGFRFGKAGWEFAFGPGFGLKQVSNGFFDTDGTFGDAGDYISEKDWTSIAYDTKGFNNEDNFPQYFESGTYTAPLPSEFNKDYDFSKEHGDTRGVTKLNTTFLFAFGRTFNAGALNIPVNVFYSSRKGGGMAGVSVGFNVMKSKKPINPREI
jgi:hypothetical protein